MSPKKKHQVTKNFKWRISYSEMPVDSIESIKKLERRIFHEGGFTMDIYNELFHKVNATSNLVLVDFFRLSIRPMVSELGRNIPDYNHTRHQSAPVISKKTEVFPGNKFIIRKGFVEVDIYRMNTNYAYNLPSGIMQQVQGTYTIHKQSDGTFYFETGHFTRMRKEIERLCHNHITNKLHHWEKKELSYIRNYIDNKVSLHIEQFLKADIDAYDRDTDTYPLVLEKQELDEFARQLPYNFYPDFVHSIKSVPEEYRKSYLVQNPRWTLLDKISEQFVDGVVELINKEFKYTSADRELDEITRHPLGIRIKLKSVKSCDAEYARFVRIPATGTKKLLSLTYRIHPGRLFKFSEEGLSSIRNALRKAKLPKKSHLNVLLEEKLELMEGHPIVYEASESYGRFFYIMNLLYDIKDNRYEKSHPKCWHLFHSGTPERCPHILYFEDPNVVVSNDYNTPTRCYLLSMGRHIRLFELDSSKSTYVFSVEEGMTEAAIFLIWSYFSSHLMNKRQDKELQIEELFDAFGIKYWLREEPISKFDDGDYFFDQETNSLI